MTTASDYHAAQQAAQQGDPLARHAMADAWQEAADGALSPYVTGQSYLFQTVTLYYVGRVVRQGPGWSMIDQASLVLRTGLLCVLMKHGFDLKKFPPSRRPITQYCGDGRIVHHGAQGAFGHPFPFPLPTESIG